jgi:hypothetical protein
MEQVRFDCVMSREVVTSTTIVLLILALVLACVVGVFVWSGFRSGWPAHVTRLSVIVISVVFIGIMAIVLFTYLYTPNSILLTNDSIVIERPLQAVAIPLAEVKAVRRAVESEFKGMIRTFGVGGLFSYMGHFHSPALGNLRMYVKDLTKVVLVDTTEGRFAVSMQNPEEFLADVQRRISLRTPEQEAKKPQRGK